MPEPAAQEMDEKDADSATVSYIADYVTAGETEIADKMRRKLEMVRRQNERRGELYSEIECLLVRLKNASGLGGDEKVLENLE